MDSMKIVLISMMLNIVLSMGMTVYNTPGGDMTSLLNVWDSDASRISEETLGMQQEKNIFTRAEGMFLSVIDGLINVAKFISQFVMMFLGNAVAVPLQLMASGTSTAIERIGATILTFVIAINNFVLIRELYNQIINKKSD